MLTYHYPIAWWLSHLQTISPPLLTLDEIWRGQRLRDYRSNWTQGNLPEVCKSCTRYQAVDQFIDENRKRVLVDYTRRKFPGLLKMLTK